MVSISLNYITLARLWTVPENVVEQEQVFFFDKVLIIILEVLIVQAEFRFLFFVESSFENDESLVLCRDHARRQA